MSTGWELWEPDRSQLIRTKIHNRHRALHADLDNFLVGMKMKQLMPVIKNEEKMRSTDIRKENIL